MALLTYKERDEEVHAFPKVISLKENVIAWLGFEHGYYEFTVQNFCYNTLKSLYIFINPSARTGYDTRSIFKRILTDLNSEFSFS